MLWLLSVFWLFYPILLSLSFMCWLEHSEFFMNLVSIVFEICVTPQTLSHVLIILAKCPLFCYRYYEFNCASLLFTSIFNWLAELASLCYFYLCLYYFGLHSEQYYFSLTRYRLFIVWRESHIEKYRFSLLNIDLLKLVYFRAEGGHLELLHSLWLSIRSLVHWF